MGILIVLGVIVILTGYFFKSNYSMARYAKITTIVGFAVLLIGVLLSSFKQIGSGNVGVQSLYGKVNNSVLESGLHVINPLVTVTEMTIQTQNYTMSAISSEGNNDGDDAIRVLSSDGLEVVIDLTVLYKISGKQAPKILKNIGEDYAYKIVRPIARTRIRDAAVYYDAVSLYSTKRDEFQSRIFETILKDFSNRGLILEQLLIRNINLPASVKLTIESKINAEQESQKMIFTLQKERQEAERKRVEAQGIADYQRIISTNLTDKQLAYEQIKAQKELAQSSNTKIIFMNGKSNTPFMISDK